MAVKEACTQAYLEMASEGTLGDCLEEEEGSMVLEMVVQLGYLVLGHMREVVTVGEGHKMLEKIEEEHMKEVVVVREVNMMKVVIEEEHMKEMVVVREVNMMEVVVFH